MIRGTMMDGALASRGLLNAKTFVDPSRTNGIAAISARKGADVEISHCVIPPRL